MSIVKMGNEPCQMAAAVAPSSFTPTMYKKLVPKPGCTANNYARKDCQCLQAMRARRPGT